MISKDWTLLVLAAGEGRVLSPVQLQKALFLLGRNLDEGQLRVSEFYKFRAYDYGPFNQQIYQDAEQLRDDGLIIIDPSTQAPYRDYSPTIEGVQRARALRESLSASVVEYLDRVVAWVSSLSFTALVRAIYRDYPEMKVNSVFRE